MRFFLIKQSNIWYYSAIKDAEQDICDVIKLRADTSKQDTVITLTDGTDRHEQTVDPNKTPPSAASDPGLLCLLSIHQLFGQRVVKWTLKF